MWPSCPAGPETYPNLHTHTHPPSFTPLDFFPASSALTRALPWPVACAPFLHTLRSTLCAVASSLCACSQRPHAVLECVPVSQRDVERAPAYFKKAMQEAESEWSTHHAKVGPGWGWQPACACLAPAMQARGEWIGQHATHVHGTAFLFWRGKTHESPGALVHRDSCPRCLSSA